MNCVKVLQNNHFYDVWDVIEYLEKQMNHMNIGEEYRQQYRNVYADIVGKFYKITTEAQKIYDEGI